MTFILNLRLFKKSIHFLKKRINFKINVQEIRHSKKAVSQSTCQNCQLSCSSALHNQVATLRAKGFCHALCQNVFFLIRKLLCLLSLCLRKLRQKLNSHRLLIVRLALRVTTGSGFGFSFKSPTGSKANPNPSFCPPTHQPALQKC